MKSESDVLVNSSKRLTGLDGLRFVAIMILVLGHCAQKDFVSIGNGSAIMSLPLPDGCLTILFVLSGFLAGYFSEKIKDVKNYYLKRAVRLFPVYYFYLIVVSLAFLLLGNKSEVCNNRLWYYVFSMGIIPFSKSNGVLPFVHLWFVSSVVLFYVLFPWIVKASNGKLRQWSFACLAFFFACKLVVYFCFGKDTMAYRLIASSQFDCIFCGVYVASLLKEHNQLVKAVGDSRVAIAFAWLLFLVSGIYSSLIPAPIRNEFFMVVAAVLILGLVSNRSMINLEGKFWSFMGKISYDIFVIHIVVLLSISRIYQNFGVTEASLLVSIVTYVLATGITITLAWLCNEYIEKPFSKINCKSHQP